ncbi:hypothetical protein B0T24DRAFT_622189 [Lasiosphaeria ovina]|uniref:SGNH hydrolase-type esterase domain-containing protein n=1 Tax=Lasiosphaeria ovina TaxID=92902 RepID=A0AAE0N703_9PEZI|nr:hypothetical protein B0T24DRAFT_622189 [Lasiosphaeria ovina]
MAASAAPPDDAVPVPVPVLADVEALLRPQAKYKARSHDTSQDEHIPLLRRQDFIKPTVVLLGDSMLERMTTTGESPSLIAPWPSPAMLSDAALAALASADSAEPDASEPLAAAKRARLPMARLDGVFNAGVGGDKVQNMSYRLVGSAGTSETEDLPALASLLAARGGVKLWVVQAGTNNLAPKKGLRDGDLDALRTMVRSLLLVPSPSPEVVPSRVLLTGLFPRKDFPRALTDAANDKLVDLVRSLNAEPGNERVVFLPPAEDVLVDSHLVDHVHLSLEGYVIWVRKLFPAVIDMLRRIEEDEVGET